MLLSGSHDETVRVWDVQSKQCIRTLTLKGGRAAPYTPALLGMLRHVAMAARPGSGVRPLLARFGEEGLAQVGPHGADPQGL